MAAAMPCPATSPTISAVRAPGSSIASNHAPCGVRSGKVELADVHGGMCGRWLGEKPALDGLRDDPLAHELTGVVDAERSMGTHCGRHRDVLLLEGVLLLVAVEADHAQGMPAQRQRSHDQGVRTGSPDDFGSCRVGGQPRAVLRDRHEARPKVGQDVREGVPVGSGRTSSTS